MNVIARILYDNGGLKPLRHESTELNDGEP